MRRISLVLLAVLAACLAAGAATAAPPSLQQEKARQKVVLARIDRIGANLEKTVQQYDGALLRLHRVERNLQLNEYALRVARANLKAAQARLSERLVSLYENGQPGTLDVLAGAKSLSDMIDRLESANALSQQDAALGETTLRFQGTVTHREKLLRRQRKQRAATAARLAARKRTIEAAYAQQKRLAASINQTIQGIIARRQQEARRLAALQQARLAAEIRARQQTSPPDQGLVSSPVPSVIGGSGAGHPEAAQIALRYLGVPYMWGGASPGGFDCSGLVMYAYAQLGIYLPHYTVSQWNATIPISMSDLQPGDLIFFDGLGHVGMYIGGGQFVHAPHTGTVVQVSSLASWGGSIDGARRVP
jgi:cell wall-associated NlpC family hydrolase